MKLCSSLPSYRHGRSTGFTLLEMLVVLVIIGLLGGLVGPRLFSKVDSAKAQTATTQIKLLRGAIETMRLDINRYPTDEEGARLLATPPTDAQTAPRWKGPYLDGPVPVDPWGAPYLYKLSTGLQPFLVFSYGADGKPGGAGADADVGIEPVAPASGQP